MARIGAFDRHLEPLAWWEAELIPAGWYVDELLVEPASGVTGTLTATLGSATLSSTGTGPSTLSAIVIPSSNNPSYKAGFYSPRRGGTPKYPSLWDGCVGAWAPSLGATGGILFDHSVYGNHGTLTDMDPASDWVVSGGKGALDFDGSNDYVSTSGNVFKNTTTALFMWVYSTSAGASRDNQTVYSTSTYTHYFSVGASTLNLYHTGPATWQSSGSLTINAWQHVGFIINGSTRKLFLNGSEIASVSDTTASIYSGTHSMRFGARVDGVFSPFQGRIDDIRIYDRPLAGTEIRTLASRRGIAYERASRKLSLFSASAPTGTVSAVLADATLSATGTLASGASGTLTSTLDAATLASSGTVGSGVTATVSVTLAAATLSASGTLAAGLSGTVTRTLDNASLSSSGALAAGLTGSTNTTLANATLSSSGTIGSGLTGSVSSTLAQVTCSSTGTLTAGLSGSVTRTLADVTSSATGTLAAGASGSVTRTLDNATLSSTGGAAGSVTGSVSASLAAVSCSSSATLAAGLSGTVTRTLADVTSSATGTVTNGASGSVTRTLADATLVSTGSFSPGLTAQVNRALDSCVVSSSGTLSAGATGTLSVQLASATLQSSNVALGGFRLKVAGEWKNANAFVKVTGTWKSATPFVKVSGVWK
jgi:hypothetical protein